MTAFRNRRKHFIIYRIGFSSVAFKDYITEVLVIFQIILRRVRLEELAHEFAENISRRRFMFIKYLRFPVDKDKLRRNVCAQPVGASRMRVRTSHIIFRIKSAAEFIEIYVSEPFCKPRSVKNLIIGLVFFIFVIADIFRSI